MNLVSVAQAADLLGVTPARVRQRVADGSLRAEKVGGVWLLDEAAVVPAAVGRPLGESLALAVAAWWDGIPPRPATWEEDRVRAKIRQIEGWSDHDLPRMVRQTFAGRARRRTLRVPEATAVALQADDRVLPSGVSDPRLVIACEPEELPTHIPVSLEAYVPWLHTDRVLADHGLPPWDQIPEKAPAGEVAGAVVILRESPGFVGQVPRLLSMADLLEHQDAVCTSAAVRLFRGRRRSA